MGVDRMTDRFDAEKIQVHGAVQQEIVAATGAAFQVITQVRLLDQTVSVPTTEAVVDQRVWQ
ncbi:hypothetical protein D3C76_1754060 [compost metagenome]